MKTCIACKKEMPLSGYYKHTQMADGHLNKCINCVKEYARSRSKLPHIRQYDRNRPNAYERVKRKGIRENEKYKNDPEYRLKKLAKQREARAKHKKQNRARAAINRGVLARKIIPRLNCERCDIASSLQGHHEDYNKPLDVIWLCTKCHGIRHKEINELERNNADK